MLRSSSQGIKRENMVFFKCNILLPMYIPQDKCAFEIEVYVVIEPPAIVLKDDQLEPISLQNILMSETHIQHWNKRKDFTNVYNDDSSEVSGLPARNSKLVYIKVYKPMKRLTK